MHKTDPPIATLALKGHVEESDNSDLLNAGGGALDLGGHTTS